MTRSFEVVVPGGRLFAEETGDGEAVLLLHAGVADRRVFDATMPALAAAGFRTIRYDARGLGRSEAGPEPYSLVADALAVLAAAGVDAAHFVGLSQGAATSVDVALAAPQRVRSLTLIAPGLSGHPLPQLPGYPDRLAAYERGDAAGLALETARLWAPLSAPGFDDAAAGVIRAQQDRFMQDELEIEEPSAVERLGAVQARTLVVLGEQDLPEIAEVGRVLTAGIPGARAVTLPDADHMLPLRVPGTLHELLLAHLRG